jgi:hypothetical protein
MFMANYLAESYDKEERVNSVDHYKHVHLLSVCLSVCLSVGLSVCLFVHPSCLLTDQRVAGRD